MSEFFIGTNGLSVWASSDRGETISRLPTTSRMYSGSQVWSLAAHKDRPGRIYAGTDSGLYEMDQQERIWRRIPFPVENVRLITSLCFCRKNADLIIAGTQPAGLIKSEDGGKSWQQLPVPMKPYVTRGFQDSGNDGDDSPIRHWTRVTAIVMDCDDPNIFFAGVEIDGAWRTRDGGKTWDKLERGLTNSDLHGLELSYRDGMRTLHAATGDGVYYSTDDGDAFTQVSLDSPSQYVRTVLALEGQPGTLLVTNGDGPPGSWGRLFRSDNEGRSWIEVALPGPVESSLYFIAQDRTDRNLVYAAATLGQVYRSEDGGRNWRAVGRRLGEIRALMSV
ncbi:hypothetical protein [Mesorhizobium sp. 1B3]|uniref:WD40/YVTN/BNR-like repeat-containing protein n=1 Tax=Mesorhizobium sp. 1B3 TaxID=3243599 RepID=UPI003D978164